MKIKYKKFFCSRENTLTPQLLFSSGGRAYPLDLSRGYALTPQLFSSGGKASLRSKATKRCSYSTT